MRFQKGKFFDQILTKFLSVLVRPWRLDDVVLLQLRLLTDDDVSVDGLLFV